MEEGKTEEKAGMERQKVFATMSDTKNKHTDRRCQHVVYFETANMKDSFSDMELLQLHTQNTQYTNAHMYIVHSGIF